MDKHELEKRTKAFALRVVKFVAALPKNTVTNVMGYQLVKAGTSIGSNYREANRAVSRNDFINKIGIVEKESAETEYWLELFDESDIGEPDERRWLLQESGELLAIFTSIGKTTKMNTQIATSRFQEVLEAVETLPLDDQVLLIEIVRQRLIQDRRAELISEVAEARQAYRRGDVRRGTVDDLMRELMA